MGVGGELHAPAALSLGKRPGSHCRGGWVGLKPLSSSSFFKDYSSNQNRSPPSLCNLSKPCQRHCQRPSLRRNTTQENTGMGTVIYRVRVVLAMCLESRSAISSGLNSYFSHSAHICIHATKLTIAVLSR
jgi:hypothetical protein